MFSDLPGVDDSHREGRKKDLKGGRSIQGRSNEKDAAQLAKRSRGPTSMLLISTYKKDKTAW